uniref:Uncharacterized protein n=1 Tax=Schlesneria paludicola TaxID=360056 RepID=A0A7C4LJE5_9PLAN
MRKFLDFRSGFARNRPEQWLLLVIQGLAGCAAALLRPTAASAQSPGPFGPAFGGQSYWMDAALFVALAGGALFAVCRSSQRV